MQWRAEAVGCPGPTRFLDAPKIFCITAFSRKISDDLFLVVHLNFHFFRISCQVSREFAPWIPPSAASCPGNDFFTSLLVIYLHFCKKTGPLDAPRVDVRGRHTVRTPSARHCTAGHPKNVL